MQKEFHIGMILVIGKVLMRKNEMLCKILGGR